MSWNYRVFKTIHENSTEYDIREIYYESGNDKNPTAYTADPVKPEAFWEDVNSTPIDDLRWQLEQMLEALDKPVLTEQDFNNTNH